MNLLSRLAGAESQRSAFPAGVSIDDYLSYFTFNGSQYPLGLKTTMSGSRPIEVGNDFDAYVEAVGRRNGVVGAAVAARGLLLSQVRFKWRSSVEAENGRLFGTVALAPLEGSGRANLLRLAETHVSYAGNAYFYREPGSDMIRLLRPDYVSIVLSSPRSPTHKDWALDAEVQRYLYRPGGPKSEPITLMPDTVAHWMPEPDPLNPWRGESWIMSVIREVSLDGQATDHLAKFYENAATPNLVFTLDPSVTQTQAEAYAEALNERHAGTHNAHKNLVIGGGADVEVVGANLQQLSYRDTQGGHETRIASRSRVPAVVLGISEGMQGSALNSGNYAQTRRLWADGWFTPTADSLCAALEPLLDRPDGGPVELSYDPSRIMFLQEDRKDDADIAQTQSVALRQLVEGGFDPQSAVAAVTTGDMSKLTHTGKLSVQLQDTNNTPEVAQP